MASKMAAKLENPIYWYFLLFFLNKSIHFCYLAFSTSLAMLYHASELFIIKDVLEIYTQQKQNNECMFITTCLESRAADDH